MMNMSRGKVDIADITCFLLKGWQHSFTYNVFNVHLMQMKLGSVEKKTYQTFHSTVLVLFCVTRSSADSQIQTIKNIINAQKRASKLITENKNTKEKKKQSALSGLQ